MSTKSSRILHRTFLTCTLFALLFVPQIGITGTALAAKRPTKFPSPVSLAVPDQCLSLALSSIVDSQAVPVSNPPGQTVSFAAVVVLYNNCGTTIMSGATVTGAVNTTCPANSTVGSSPSVSATFKDPIVDRKQANERGIGYSDCIVQDQNTGTPIATILPASATLVLEGTGTDINGKVLRAPAVNLPIWGAGAKSSAKTKK